MVPAMCGDFPRELYRSYRLKIKEVWQQQKEFLAVDQIGCTQPKSLQIRPKKAESKCKNFHQTTWYWKRFQPDSICWNWGKIQYFLKNLLFQKVSRYFPLKNSLEQKVMLTIKWICNKISDEIRLSNMFRPKSKFESVSTEIIWIFAPLFCNCWAVSKHRLVKLRSCKLFLEPKQLRHFVKMAQNIQKISKY